MVWCKRLHLSRQQCRWTQCQQRQDDLQCRHHLVLFPVTSAICKALPASVRSTSLTNLSFLDLDKLPQATLLNVCEWLHTAVDVFSKSNGQRLLRDGPTSHDEIVEVCWLSLRCTALHCSALHQTFKAQQLTDLLKQTSVTLLVLNNWRVCRAVLLMSSAETLQLSIALRIRRVDAANAAKPCTVDAGCSCTLGF